MQFLANLAAQQGISNYDLFLIAGPCVIESEQLAIDTASILRDLTTKLQIPFIYKTSFAKANRTSARSYSGVGVDEGLKILQAVKKQVGVPVLTDVHEDTPLEIVSAVVDVLQTPAFLCRQTNFIQKVANQGLPVNIKKGQFLSPGEMQYVVQKAQQMGNNELMLCERGVSFGYNNLVVDMRSLAIMRKMGFPVVFDATHAVQQPGALSGKTGGDRQYVPVLARAAVAAGIDGIFIETHPNPAAALSDAAVMWPLAQMTDLMSCLKEIARVYQNNLKLALEQNKDFI